MQISGLGERLHGLWAIRQQVCNSSFGSYIEGL